MSHRRRRLLFKINLMFSVKSLLRKKRTGRHLFIAHVPQQQFLNYLKHYESWEIFDWWW